MATKLSLRKVASAITGLTTAVANTFVEAAVEIADACHDAFGGSTDIENGDIVAIQNAVAENAPWNGTSSESARRSEVKAIVLAYPNLASACRTFKREYGELRREHFVKVARLIPDMATATDAGLEACDFFEKRDANKGGTGRKATLGMAFGIIKNLDSDKGVSKRKLIAFRRELAELCKKHGIKF